jgi:anaerobic ribonucleoside-triphosphate reductase activating protein
LASRDSHAYVKTHNAPTVELNKAHWPVTVLGPGRRIGLWLQGCTIRCKGCVSQDTWPRDASRTIAVSTLVEWCRRTAPDGPDGVTISGGEPFEQPAGLRALLRGLVAWRRNAGLDFDILCYSGYPLTRLRRQHAAILDLLDAIIPEPFVEAAPLTHLWRGSGNQPLVPLSQRGRERYATHVDADADRDGKRMQVAIEGGRVWMIGIPARGDMARVETLCAERGLELRDVSWRR